MIHRLPVALLAAALAPFGAFAQPTIRSAAPVLNAASFAIPPLPNSSIAQGSIFAIFGSDLGPTTGVQPSGFPLPTVLPASSGSSVQVTVGATTVSAYLFYVSATQINALMPSKTPTGSGTITVTFNGQTSATAPVTVVANTVGIFTIASSGNGPGVFTDFSLSGKEVSYDNAANAGERVTAWTTGLGAISGDDSQLPPTGNITASDAKVFVGGTAATVHYYGRSGCCAGLDQISFDVPAGITGCNVPVSVQTTGGSSNFPTMAIAAPGSRACQDGTGVGGADYNSIFASGSTRIGSFVLERFSTVENLGSGPATTVTSDLSAGSFHKDEFTAASGAGLSFTIPNIGGCSVFTFTGQRATVTGSFESIGLDAGTITVTGPNGAMQLLEGITGSYEGNVGSNAPGSTTPLYLSPGSYTVSNGGGSGTIGGFSFDLTMPSAFTWTNQTSITAINRASGVTVNWTGADPGASVIISGSSENGTDTSNLVGGAFTCFANAAAGTFTVPAQVTDALPPSSSISASGVAVQTGNLSVGTYSPETTFTATGLDYGIASAEYTINQPVTYQ